MEELYDSYRYLDYTLLTVKDGDYFYTSIYYNGTCLRNNIKKLSYERCINECKDIIDCWENMNDGIN